MSRDQFIKMRGAWDTRHWISVPGLSHPADALQLEASLSALQGMNRVVIYPEQQRIRVTYDQTRLDYQHILEQLEMIGFPASTGWWSLRKAGWFQYLDQTARENARAPEPPCCSNPKGIGGRHERKK
ncbi:MAG: heavy-metal-associated domain-containing protein [Sedimenticola sp.]|nr:heavy-metal-associated domain-containing protein [Sedimenticola sp.]